MLSKYDNILLLVGGRFFRAWYEWTLGSWVVGSDDVEYDNFLLVGGYFLSLGDRFQNCRWRIAGRYSKKNIVIAYEISGTISISTRVG